MSITISGNITISGSIDLAPPPSLTPVVTTRIDRFTVTAQGNQMAYTLPIDRMITVQVAYLDSGGNPAPVQAVAWSASNDTLLTVAPDANDDTTCAVTPIGPLGSCQVVATADADLGAGVTNVLTTLDITLVAGEAVVGTINVVGDPQPIPGGP